MSNFLQSFEKVTEIAEPLRIHFEKLFGPVSMKQDGHWLYFTFEYREAPAKAKGEAERFLIQYPGMYILQSEYSVNDQKYLKLRVR